MLCLYCRPWSAQLVSYQSLEDSSPRKFLYYCWAISLAELLSSSAHVCCCVIHHTCSLQRMPRLSCQRLCMHCGQFSDDSNVTCRILGVRDMGSSFYPFTAARKGNKLVTKGLFSKLSALQQLPSHALALQQLCLHVLPEAFHGRRLSPFHFCLQRHAAEHKRPLQ